MDNSIGSWFSPASGDNNGGEGAAQVWCGGK